jgi:hypothetical protein
MRKNYAVLMNKCAKPLVTYTHQPVLKLKEISHMSINADDDATASWVNALCQHSSDRASA